MGVFLLLLLVFEKIFQKVEIIFPIDPLQHQVQKARKLLPHKLVPSPLGDKKEESSFVQAHLRCLVEICIFGLERIWVLLSGTYAGLFKNKNCKIGGLLNIHNRTQPNLAKGPRGK
jgi:hypothetical protein